mgnify:CR=1 FL=1
MRGLELARAYYEQFGAPMIHEQFPQIEGLIACGLAGSGSECFGYDDEISRDHDFDPGFCLFVPEDLIDSRTLFRLSRAYAKLPEEFEGCRRQRLSPVGGNRRGVLEIGEFFQTRIGRPDGLAGDLDWFRVPEAYLAEATNGAVFRDDLGRFTAIREGLRTMPENVRRKKLAGHVLLMAQAGQYNYSRCLAHRETGAAQLAVGEFVSHAMAAAFLLSRRYEPFYKWRFRALRELPEWPGLAEDLETLLTTGNDPETAEVKTQSIEAISARVLAELKRQGLTDGSGEFLEPHAYRINETISSAQIRTLHILYAV